MYVACRELKVSVRGQSALTVLKPGDEVKGFEKWDYSVQQAHLNMEWVKKVQDGRDATVKASEVVTPSEDKTEVAWTCSHCNKPFKRQRDLKSHVTLKHAK